MSFLLLRITHWHQIESLNFTQTPITSPLDARVLHAFSSRSSPSGFALPIRARLDILFQRFGPRDHTMTSFAISLPFLQTLFIRRPCPARLYGVLFLRLSITNIPHLVLHFLLFCPHNYRLSSIPTSLPFLHSAITALLHMPPCPARHLLGVCPSGCASPIHARLFLLCLLCFSHNYSSTLTLISLLFCRILSSLLSTSVSCS